MNTDIDNLWSEDVNNYVDTFFPAKWTKEDVEKFIKNGKYPVDIEALNKNLNLPVRTFLKSGGKRVRPKLFFTCLRLFGKNYKNYINYALFLELVHNGTLILDDIEDRSVLRRNQPTCHIKYGLDTAVNTGASLYVIPLNFIFDNNKLSSDTKLRLLNIYTEEISNLCFGQALDIYWHKCIDCRVGKSKYLEMVRLKTGSLMRMSTRFACALAGESKTIENYFSYFAETVGMAFQIRDDTLDLARYDSKFGKAYGNDITEGKISLPVVIALGKLSKDKFSRLRMILSNHTRDKKLIKEAVDLVKDCGALDESLVIAEKIIKDAWDLLESVWRDGKELEDLRDLTNFFITRKY